MPPIIVEALNGKLLWFFFKCLWIEIKLDAMRRLGWISYEQYRQKRTEI